MISTKQLATELNITEKTVRSRAAALGLTPTQAVQGAGRPKLLWTEEQGAAIANYGTTTTTTTTDLEAEEAQSAALAYVATQTALAMPMGQQFNQIAQTLEAIEDAGAEAIAHRLAQVPSRTLAKAAQKLQGAESFNIADVINGALGQFSLTPTPVLPPTPAQIRNYADNIF